jgi:signal transduction histidine kinase
MIYMATTLLLVVLSIYTFSQIRNLIDSSGLVNHSHLVEQSLQKISSALLEAETNKQRFLVTKDSLFFQKKDEALGTLSTERIMLDNLVKADMEQIYNVKQLQIVINEKITSINTIPDERKPLPISPSYQADIRNESKTMDAVKYQVEAMTLVETSLLKFRLEEYAGHSFLTPLLVILLFLSALMILLFSYWRLNTELHQTKILHDELILQNEEKEKWGVALLLANKELRYQSSEREKRAEELAVANEELHYQSSEKGKRAEELATANKELQHQSVEKEKRTVELLIVNRDLQLFTQISSHDLQEPLRKLQMAASRINGNDYDNLSEKGKGFFNSMREAASAMQTLIDDLITYSETNNEERTFVTIDLGATVEEVKVGLQERMNDKHAVIEVLGSCKVAVIPFQFRQLLHNILGNALKFSQPQIPPHIVITGTEIKGTDIQKLLHSDSIGKTELLLPEVLYCHIRIADNGIGFEPEFSEKKFEVFQRLHTKDQYKGTGIGLAIVKKIVENHNGIITASSTLNEGATFDIFLPQQTS